MDKTPLLWPILSKPQGWTQPLALEGSFSIKTPRRVERWDRISIRRPLEKHSRETRSIKHPTSARRIVVVDGQLGCLLNALYIDDITNRIVVDMLGAIGGNIEGKLD